MRAGCELTGAPATGTPVAQRIPSTTSSNVPPHLRRTRTGRILAPHDTPAMANPLFVAAATTNVPCQELSFRPAVVPRSGCIARIRRIGVTTDVRVGSTDIHALHQPQRSSRFRRAR